MQRHKVYIIRKLRPSELIEVVRINRRNLPENYPIEFFRIHLENYSEAFLVAVLDERIVGYIMNRIERGELYTRKLRYGKRGHIISIAVEPEYRGIGIGTSLMVQAMKNMKNVYHVDEYYLEVRVTNNPAISLYKKLGFKIVKTLKSYYLDGEDAYLMAKSAY